MANLVPVAASVRSYGTQKSGIAGASIARGQAVYVDASNAVLLATNATAVGCDVKGIALNDAAINQPVDYHIADEIDLGTTLAIGKVYVLGAARAIMPVDDIAGSEYVAVVGIARTAARLKCVFFTAGVAAAGAVA